MVLFEDIRRQLASAFLFYIAPAEAGWFCFQDLLEPLMFCEMTICLSVGPALLLFYIAQSRRQVSGKGS